MLDDKNDETKLQHNAEGTVMDEHLAELNQPPYDYEKDLALDWHIGDVILDLYEVIPVDDDNKVFHSGGFGKVYKVHHKTWNINLAVKAPHANTFMNQIQKDNYIKECQSWIELGMHPNIATCYYVREIEGVPRIFAEYVTEGSLKEWIDSGRLYEGESEKEVLKRLIDISIQFAWGLHYAHEKGLVHQDVKPQNVMIAEDGEVKVVDFGLARAKSLGGMLDDNSSVMVTSAGGYTPAYCSPEQISKKKLTRRTDMWSFGVSVMEMFAGGVTWESGVLAGQTLESFLEHNGEDEEIPAIPDGIANLLKECFRVDEKDRPHTMIDVANRLIEIYHAECNSEYVRKFEEGSLDAPDSLNNHALSYLDLGENDKAEQLWNNALEQDPNHLESIYNYGLLLWRTARITDTEVIQRLEHIKSNHFDSWLYNYLLGMIHIERSDAESAIKVLEDAIIKSNDDENVLNMLKIALAGKEIWSDCLHTFIGHTGLVTSIAISPDSLYVISGSYDKTIKLWELSTGNCLRTFEGHTDKVLSIYISPDGNNILSGSYDHTVKFWNISTGKCIHTFEGHEAGVSSVALSIDGCYAFSGSYDKAIKIWDVTSGECLKSFPEYQKTEVYSLAINRDGRYVLSGGLDEKLKLWDITSLKCLTIFKGHKACVNTVAISEDNRYALSGSRDESVKLWELSSGECLRTFEGHKGWVTAVSISTEGRLIFSISRDKTLKIWEVSSGKCIRTIDIQTDIESSVALSDDGHFALFCDDKMVKLWRINESNILAKWKICKPESSANASKRVTQMNKYIEQAEQMCESGNFTVAIELLNLAKSLPDCQRLKEVREAWAKLYRILPKSRFKSSWELHSLKGHTDSITTAVLSLDGNYALSGSYDKTLKLWDISSGNCNRTFEGHTGRVVSLALSSDGNYALSGSWDNTIKLWDIFSGECIHTFIGHTGSVYSVALSYDGRYIISGSTDNTMKFWEVSSGECIRSVKGNASPIVLSANGCYVLSKNWDKTIKLWDVSTGQCLRTLEGHEEAVNSLDISSDGLYALSSADRDKTLKLWDISSGKCIRTFEGHTNYVSSVALSSDGNYALSGSWDKTLKLWEVSSGKCLRTIEGHSDYVIFVALSPDSHYVLSGCTSSTILKLWELNWDVKICNQMDWDEGAKRHLQNFLRIHQPIDDQNILEHKGKPIWTEEDFNRLMIELSYRGFGFLKAEGVKNKLEEMKNEFLFK